AGVLRATDARVVSLDEPALRIRDRGYRVLEKRVGVVIEAGDVRRVQLPGANVLADDGIALDRQGEQRRADVWRGAVAGDWIAEAGITGIQLLVGHVQAAGAEVRRGIVGILAL